MTYSRPGCSIAQELVGFGTGGGSQDGIDRDAFEDFKVKVKFGAAMLVIHPQGPGHLWQGPQDAAIDGRQALQREGFTASFQRRGALGQLLHDRPQRFGRENPGGFAEGAQGSTADPEKLLNLGQSAGLLHAAQAREDRVEEIEQHQSGVLVEKKLAIPSVIALGAEMLESFQ